MSKSKKAQMKQILEKIWDLKKSPLYQYRKKNNYYPVIGEGSHNAKIMFIGEAPGKNEAESGRPFCGAAGEILDQLLEHINLDRKKVYVTNIVKDRPPGNRDPSQKEIALYSPFLTQQINIIKPKVIATLGRFSMEFVMKLLGLEDKLGKISQIHGQVFKAKAEFGKVKIVPLFHPAVALYNRNQLPTLKKDFEVLKSITETV